jgi:hypothetical protein
MSEWVYISTMGSRSTPRPEVLPASITPLPEKM